MLCAPTLWVVFTLCFIMQLSYVGIEAQTADGCPTTEAVSISASFVVCACVCVVWVA